LPTLVLGHGYMYDPKPRALTIPGHPMRWEPQSDGSMSGNCRDNGKIGPVQVTWTEGQIIEIKSLVKNPPQTGWTELRICKDPHGGNDCFEKTRLRALPPSTQGIHAPPSSADKILSPKPFRSDSRFGTTRWKLPDGFTCDHCAMQWWWITNNWHPEHHKSCHDIRIVPKA